MVVDREALEILNQIQQKPLPRVESHRSGVVIPHTSPLLLFVEIYPPR